MKSLQGKLAVISGAGGGIGCATAIALARQGARVVLCDINEPGLQCTRATIAMQGCDVDARPVDVGNRESVEAFAGHVLDLHGTVDILVNSAGVYVSGSGLELSLDDWEWVLSTNLWGTIHMCHYLLPSMVEAGRGGHVVNLASMYGYWPSPCVAGYLTSKFAVYGFSEALHEDLRPHGIGVSTVCPGIVNTGLVRAMRIRTGSRSDDTIRASLERIYARHGTQPERVAKAIVKAIRRKRRIVLVSPESRLMHRVERYAPWLSRFIARHAAARLFR